MFILTLQLDYVPYLLFILTLQLDYVPLSARTPTHLVLSCVYQKVTVLREGSWISDFPSSGEFLLIYICNFHVLSNLLLIYICKLHWIPSSDLVPGDVISVRVGDKIPADSRVIRLKTTSFNADEGSLTGESTTAPKVSEIAQLEASIAGKFNMVFSGTMVTNGACTALVVGTGSNTEIGIINAGI